MGQEEARRGQRRAVYSRRVSSIGPTTRHFARLIEAEPAFFDCGRVLFGSRVAKREAEGTVHTKHQLNLDPNPEGT